MPTTALLAPHLPLSENMYRDYIILAGTSGVLRVWALNIGSAVQRPHIATAQVRTQRLQAAFPEGLRSRKEPVLGNKLTATLSPHAAPISRLIHEAVWPDG